MWAVLSTKYSCNVVQKLCYGNAEQGKFHIKVISGWETVIVIIVHRINLSSVCVLFQTAPYSTFHCKYKVSMQLAGWTMCVTLAYPSKCCFLFNNCIQLNVRKIYVLISYNEIFIERHVDIV